MQLLGKIPEHQNRQNNMIRELSKNVADGLFETAEQMIASKPNTGKNLLTYLWEPVYEAPQINPEEAAAIRRRRNKGRSSGRSR